ncbi:MAG TPA: TetR/AcrR family transcriptional regulator [Bryobacteraceae bacterium]|nr:TetR/AcrR family transcriptional regulator [Bryobacteraceae bacterium]
MKSGERRTAIVRSAIHLFAEKGFRGTTTRELASALGVTEPVLYQHFRTKRDLYAAIIETKAREATAHSAELAELAKTGDDRAFFGFLGHLILNRYENDPELMRLLLFSCLERHELAGMFFDRLFQDFYNMVSGYVRRRVRAGAFRKVNPEIATRGLIGMIAYHGLIGLLFGDRLGQHPNRRRIIDEMVTIFLGGISAARTAETTS